METSLDQKIETLSEDELARLEEQRSWVRDHYEDSARHEYATFEGKLKLLEAILANDWINADETWKLQSLGITFGDVLVQELGLLWVAVEDDYGRDPALIVQGTTIIFFPLTTISKRIERGETVHVREMFESFRAWLEKMSAECKAD